MKFAMCIWLPSSLHACSKMYHKKGIKAYAAPLVLYAIGVALVMGGSGYPIPPVDLTQTAAENYLVPMGFGGFAVERLFTPEGLQTTELGGVRFVPMKR